MKRRDFVKTSAGIGAGIAAAPYLLKGNPKPNFKPAHQLGFEDNDNITIIIEMFGGNDGLNTIFPAEDPKLHELRDFALDPEEAIKIEEGLGLYLHPALVNDIVDDGFNGLRNTGRLSIIEGVGYKDMTMSHFRSRDIWHSGIISNDPDVPLLDGWLGRFIASKLTNYPEDVPDHPIAVSMGGNIPLALKSPKGDMGIALIDPEIFYNQGAGLEPPYSTLDDVNDYTSENNFLHTVGLQSQKYSEAIYQTYQAGENSFDYKAQSPFEQKFQTIARLINGGLNAKVYYVGLSNFDSHVMQQITATEGQHQIYLKQLARGVSNFMKDALNLGFDKRITGYTFSEFGRRAHQNGSRGTDHGAGSMMFVFGHSDGIQAGIQGTPPDLNVLDDNGNIRVDEAEDFRRFYVDFLKYRFGATDTEIETVFGEYVDPYEVLKNRTSVEDEFIKGGKNVGLSVYPNPSRGRSKLAFELKKGTKLEIVIYSYDGRYRKEIANGFLQAGNYDFDLQLSHQGAYTALLTINGRRYSTKFTVMK